MQADPVGKIDASPELPETAAVRPGEELDRATLESWLRPRLADILEGTDEPLDILQFPNGSANLTYLIHLGSHQLVLRRPPMGQLAPRARRPGRGGGRERAPPACGADSIARRAPTCSATTPRCSGRTSSSWSGGAARWCAQPFLRACRPMRTSAAGSPSRSSTRWPTSIISIPPRVS